MKIPMLEEDEEYPVQEDTPLIDQLEEVPLDLPKPPKRRAQKSATVPQLQKDLASLQNWANQLYEYLSTRGRGNYFDKPSKFNGFR